MTGKLRPARAAAAGVSAMDMKKIIVLGGDGFCGWPTTLHLADQVCLYFLATRSASGCVYHIPRRALFPVDLAILMCCCVYSGTRCGECGQPLAPQHRHGNGLRFAHPHPGARAVSIVVSVTFMSTSVSAYIHT